MGEVEEGIDLQAEYTALLVEHQELRAEHRRVRAERDALLKAPAVQLSTVSRDEPAPGLAPCGATYGTAAGPNDGVTHCGNCGAVHPLAAGARYVTILDGRDFKSGGMAGLDADRG